jgi:transcriptional regulator with PAS, ATPase and Fis domain/pSer/pThr/pTyr-binding forkhead associated (FHA) protein
MPQMASSGDDADVRDPDAVETTSETRRELGVLVRNRPKLLVIAGKAQGQKVRLRNRETVLGRSTAASFQLLDDGVSRRHARVIRDGNHVVLEDLASQNGTFVNENRVTRCELKDGDKIRLGSVTILKFIYEDKLDEALSQPEWTGRDAQGGDYFLLIVGKQFGTFWLSASGRIKIGRADSCELRLDDPSISGVAALLEIGPPFQLEVVGETEVTLHGEPVERGRRALVPLGELMTIGNVRLVVQKRPTTSLRHISAHDYFETRLEEECLRAHRTAAPFAVIHVMADPRMGEQVVQEILVNALREMDPVACYGPGEYEALLLDTSVEAAERVRLRLLGDFESRCLKATVGIVCHPRDGRSSHALLAEARSRARPEQEITTDQLVAIAPSQGPMQQVMQLVERIGVSDISVLILGETGAGKERLAEAVHKNSRRKNNPMICLNCAALSESLLESELFGHERGSFTGAQARKLGLLETAAGGTVFLDEIGEMPVSLQGKLLRVLEERKVRRVGGLETIPIDVRFISATNRDLENESARGTFRQDFYFRLNGITLVVPPLRERPGEIAHLANHFLVDVCAKIGRTNVPTISEGALALLQQYRWPGNIRELRNVIERAAVLCEKGLITLEHLPVERMRTTFAETRGTVRPDASSRTSTIGESVEATPDSAPASLRVSPPDSRTGPPSESGLMRRGVLNQTDRTPTMDDLRKQLEDHDRQRIVEALAACGGNQTEAARILGIARRTLVNRLEAYGIARPRKGRTRTDSG